MAVAQSDLTVEVAESFEHAFDQLINPGEWDTLLSKAQSNVVFLTVSGSRHGGTILVHPPTVNCIS